MVYVSRVQRSCFVLVEIAADVRCFVKFGNFAYKLLPLLIPQHLILLLILVTRKVNQLDDLRMNRTEHFRKDHLHCLIPIMQQHCCSAFMDE